jgi:hypothetical protein
MATANAEDFSDLHERVLRFMGAFQRPSSPSTTSSDSTCDAGCLIWVRRCRSSSSARTRTISACLCYEGDLTHFESIYLRAKQLTDLIGHSLNVTGPVYSQDSHHL